MTVHGIHTYRKQSTSNPAENDSFQVFFDNDDRKCDIFISIECNFTAQFNQ